MCSYFYKLLNLFSVLKSLNHYKTASLYFFCLPKLRMEDSENKSMKRLGKLTFSTASQPQSNGFSLVILRIKETLGKSGQIKPQLVSRKADQIQRQCSLFRVANTAIKGDFETIALPPNKGLLIQEGNSNSLL